MQQQEAEKILEGLRQKLIDEGGWPKKYMFKFIAPNQPLVLNAVVAQLPKGKTDLRASKNGKYIAVSHVATMPSADAVINVTSAISSMPGVISL